MFDNLKKWAVEKVIWAEKNLKGKTGAEKKTAVVKMLDDMIKLPAYLEWVDDLIISWVVDKACELLNDEKGHDFGSTELDAKTEQKISSEIEIPEELL